MKFKSRSRKNNTILTKTGNCVKVSLRLITAKRSLS